MTENSIIPSFHFRVLFPGLKDVTDYDTRFESVAGVQGMTASADTGRKAISMGPLVLRRAMAAKQSSGLRQWVIMCLHNGSADSKPLPEVQVQVLGNNHQPIINIRLKEVSFKSWVMGALHAGKSDVLMEEIQLDYKFIEVLIV